MRFNALGLRAESVPDVEALVRLKRPYKPKRKPGVTITMTKKPEKLLEQQTAGHDSSPAKSYFAVVAFFIR